MGTEVDEIFAVGFILLDLATCRLKRDFDLTGTRRN